VELADTLCSGRSAHRACGFKSHLRHFFVLRLLLFLVSFPRPTDLFLTMAPEREMKKRPYKMVQPWFSEKKSPNPVSGSKFDLQKRVFDLY
jgi:hypothetical protein